MLFILFLCWSVKFLWLCPILHAIQNSSTAERFVWTAPLLYIREFIFPSAWVWIHFTFARAFYICQKYNLFILKTNKQSPPRFKKPCKRNITHYFPKKQPNIISYFCRKYYNALRLQFFSPAYTQFPKLCISFFQNFTHKSKNCTYKK